jgi:hypothetical protein
MLTTMEVMIGKWKLTFPFLKEMSPGSLPINVHKAPTMIRMMPKTIKVFPIGMTFHLLIPK